MAVFPLPCKLSCNILVARDPFEWKDGEICGTFNNAFDVTLSPKSRLICDILNVEEKQMVDLRSCIHMRNEVMQATLKLLGSRGILF